jgi:regulator of protease activity HflC (stomatin/prohibitin superfamily)
MKNFRRTEGTANGLCIAKKNRKQRKRVEAQGISDYNRIVSQSITDQVLQLKGIEATLEVAKSTNSKMVIMNGKNMPLIFGAPGF